MKIEFQELPQSTRSGCSNFDVSLVIIIEESAAFHSEEATLHESQQSNDSKNVHWTLSEKKDV